VTPCGTLPTSSSAFQVHRTPAGQAVLEAATQDHHVVRNTKNEVENGSSSSLELAFAMATISG
jgi:hypothetical protein